MCRSDEAGSDFAGLASDLAALCEEAIESGRLDAVPDEALGQLFASVLRVFAAKAQEGGDPRPFGRNSGVSVTDAVIGATALLDSVNLSVFELGAWQSLGGIGRQRKPQAGGMEREDSK